MQQLSGQDASFVYLETPNTPMHIGSVAIYDPSTAPGGKVRFKDILRHIEARLHLARPFRQKLVRVPGNLDHPYWIEDENFDIEFHVRHIALPEPGDWRQLCIQVARLHSRPMDMSKPLWEFTVVEGLDNIEGLPAGCFALVSKVHHAAIDGMSGVDMTSAIHALEAEAPAPPPPATPWKAEKAPGLGELLVRTQINNIAQPFAWMKTVADSVPGLARLGQGWSKRELSFENVKPAPRTRFNAKVGPHRAFEGALFDLADVRAVRAAVAGATVNDVMLAVVGGALRNYLEAKGDLPRETMSAMAPISVRAEGEKGSMGNLVSAMVVGLGTHIADPLERLAYVHGEAENSKAMTNAVGARTLAEYSKLLPSALAGLGARLYTQLGLANRMSQAFNCVVTNVPGPRVPIYMAGARMVVQYGTGPIFDGMGLIHPVYSYGDRIAVSFVADREVMPDPAFYAQCLAEAFAELKVAAAGAAAPVAPSTPKKKARHPATAAA